MQSYQYLPLNAESEDIRLLTLQRSQDIGFDDPVHCSISHVSLREIGEPRYETISYVWGSARETASIFLNGRELTVPKSAEQALRCMRLHDTGRERELWIDAVCIDQDNMSERAQQVTMMGDIYRHTAGNLIYLGGDDGTIARAMLDIKLLLNEIRLETDCFRTFFDTVFDKDGHYWRRTDSPLSTRIDSNALLNFFSRPWFGRLWVFQEIIFPSRSTFIIGPHEIDASEVLRVAVWLNYKSSVPKSLEECQGRHNAVDMAYMAAVIGTFERGRLRRPSFRYLMAISTRFDTSDPRDHIYAIFDLLRSSAPNSSQYFHLIAPDYRKPISQVYRDATVFSLIKSKSLDIWRNVYHRGDRALDLQGNPSWVPQWHRTFDFRKDVYRLPEIFDASLGSQVSSPALIGGLESITQKLPLRGFRIASISRVTETMTSALIGNVQFLRNLFEAIETIVAGQQSIPRRNTERELARTLTAGYCDEGFPELRSSLQECNAAALIDDDNITQIDAGRGGEYYDAFREWCVNRRFFGAEHGYIGIAANPVKSGDLIAILYGAPWPVILRPLDDFFQFVCQCYVDGIMQGEAVHEHREKEMVDELFTLI